MQYTITKNTSGVIIRCASYSVLPAPLATGETACDAATYQAALTALLYPPQTLAQQATTALAAAAGTTWSEYGMYGAAPPATWQTYLTALRAIADGTDTTSTALPAVPAS